MLDEAVRRRVGFETGMAVRLADGQSWMVPWLSGGPGAWSAADREAVQAVWEAEDAAECRRAELALAIRLLGRNYRLGPDDLTALLLFEPGDPRLAEAQDAFRVMGWAHVERLGPRLVPVPPMTAGAASLWELALTPLRWAWGRLVPPHGVVQVDQSSHVRRPAITTRMEDPGGATGLPGVGAI